MKCPGLAALGVAIAITAPCPAAAQGRDIAMERFDADVIVQPDASISVTETLRIRFTGEWNGVQRIISLQHRTASGRRTRLHLDIGDITDGAGQPLEVEKKRGTKTRTLRIYVPGARDATRTVVIHYTVSNALRFFEESDPSGLHDELYWNVTGNEWELPIERASVRVVLPPDAGAVQAWAYTGPARSTSQDATVRVAGGEVTAVTSRPLSSGEGMTVSVSWPPGAVARPGASARQFEKALVWWPVAVPVLVLLFAFRAWSTGGKDPKKRTVVVAYEPPDDLSPGEVGTLIDHDADAHDLTSTLVDLAVRGYVLIEEKREKRLLGLTSSKEYYFHLRRARADWSDLRPHERVYLDGLFATRTRKSKPIESDEVARSHGSVRLSDLKNNFYTQIEPIRNAIYDRLTRRGLYARRPDRVRGRWSFGAIAFIVAGFAGAGFVSEGVPIAGPIPLAAGFMLSGIIVGVFGRFMPARTEAGARACEQALGFREFLSRVESPRFEAVITGPELFEKYLPYAMAFRCEDRWARAFESLLVTPPDWYRGGDGHSFHAGSFTRDLGSMSTQASSTMSSSPSGSGGGGSSGGGSGGGGGGGF